ncbi:MAG: hypothetical protein P8Z79_06185, partial [Sedimentisphaerales bacterium]
EQTEDSREEDGDLLQGYPTQFSARTYVVPGNGRYKNSGLTVRFVQGQKRRIFLGIVRFS